MDIVTFMGWNISSNFGKRLFRFMSVIVPLMPTFALVLYNGVQLESLVTKNYILEDNYNQLQNAISMSILVSSLQDERYNLAFLTFSYTKGKQIKYSADVIEDFARTDTAIAGLDPWRTEIPLKDFASRVRFQVWGLSQITLACFSCFLTPSPPWLAIVSIWVTPLKNYVRFCTHNPP